LIALSGQFYYDELRSVTRETLQMVNRTTSTRLLYVLFVAQSLFTSAQTAIFTLASIVAVWLAGTENVAGTYSSVLIFSQAFVAFPVAIVMGRVGRRLGLTMGFVAGALAGILGMLAIVSGSFLLLMVSASLLGMARGSLEQGRFAAGEMFPEAERARMIGRLVFAGTIGAVVGPLLVSPSGQLMESLGQSADMGPWAVGLALYTVGGLLIFLLLRPDPMTLAAMLGGQNSRRREAEQTARPLSTLLMLPKVQLGIIGALVSQTVMVVLMVMTPLHMDHQHHSRDHISMVISMHSLGMFGLSALTGYLIDRLGRVRMLLVGAAIMIASALLAPVSTHEYVLAVALFLLGLGWNFGYVAGSSLLADALQGTERLRVQGINDSLVFFVAGFGSLASGPLFASGGFAAVSMAGLVCTLALIGFIVWLGRTGTATSYQSSVTRPKTTQ
jgi:MFS family permease